MTNTTPLDRFRRAAKALKASYEKGEPDALARLAAHPPRRDSADFQHADYLHVIAQENSFASWPIMKEAIETLGLDRAEKLQRLKIALHHGQNGVVQRLLADQPDLAAGYFGLQCGLLNVRSVWAMLSEDPSLATTSIGPWSPLIHLCKSRMYQLWPDKASDAVAIADMLVANGADVNSGSLEHGSPLSPLYWALGHAGNLELAKWLLENRADPNDGESLYHATELGHAKGVALLLENGCDPNGTNALKRAMDFDNLGMVQLLIDAGADPNEGHNGWTVLHHAALRMSSEPVCRALIEAGADPTKIGQGISAYAAAKVYGNGPLAAMMTPVPLSPQEELLAQAATGQVPDDTYVDTAKLPEIYLDLVREFAGAPGKLDHLKALIKIGMPWDRPDGQGVPPVQIAGWLGRPEMLAYFLSLRPDLGHVNGYGGTLLSTILHGSENNPERKGRDYIGCLRLALEAGVALPRRAIEASGDTDIRAFLQDWAAAKPGQVVAYGIV